MNHGLPNCGEPAVNVCPKRFLLAASQWIDSSNGGSLAPGKLASEGVRLRWDCPLFDDADLGRHTAAKRFPSQFGIYRAQLPEEAALFRPNVTAGHQPRYYAPTRCWVRLPDQPDDAFTLSAAACDTVNAVCVTMPAQAGQATVSLKDSQGTVRVVAELKQGDVFYFELADLACVKLSRRVTGIEVRGLPPQTKDSLRQLDLDFRPIAAILTQKNVHQSYSDSILRLANDAQNARAYSTLDENLWDEFQNFGAVLINEYDRFQNQGTTLPATWEQRLRAWQSALHARWESAAMAGFGFLDGPREPSPLETFGPASQLLGDADENYYAYYVDAHFDNVRSPDVVVHSEVCFTQAKSMPSLKQLNAELVDTPTACVEAVTTVNQVAEGEKPVAEGNLPRETTVCELTLRLTAASAWEELAFTTPHAAASAITQGRATEGAAQLGPNSATTLHVSGMEVSELRRHRFEIPYLDSDISLEVLTGDSWDRRADQATIGPVAPEIDYRGTCAALVSGVAFWDRNNSQSQATLRFVPRSEDSKALAAFNNWRADKLATHAKATVDFLLSKPDAQRVVLAIRVGPVALIAGDEWSAAIEGGNAAVASETRSRLVGGMMLVGTFAAHIVGFVVEPNAGLTVRFAAHARCAGAALYDCDSDWVAANLAESEDSSALWQVINDDDNPLLLTQDGALSVNEVSRFLPEQRTSQMLYFSSRLAFKFKENHYKSGLSPRLAVPYVHKAPDKPDEYLDVRSLAVDYYGRTLVRSERIGPVPLRYGLQVELRYSEGDIDESASQARRIEQEKELVEQAQIGLFGPQYPFERRVAFEAFDRLTSTTEHTTNSIAVRYVREDDKRESEAQRITFIHHRVD